MTGKLSHTDASGKASMVDVSAKPETDRIARATGTILMAVKYADRSGEKARRTTTWAALPLMALGAYGTYWSMTRTSGW